MNEALNETMDVKFKFGIGDRVKDKLSPLEGIVVACDIWFTGCRRFCVKSGLVSDGVPVDGVWIDEIRLDLIEDAAIEFSEWLDKEKK